MSFLDKSRTHAAFVAMIELFRKEFFFLQPLPSVSGRFVLAKLNVNKLFRSSALSESLFLFSFVLLTSTDALVNFDIILFRLYSF